MGSVFSASDRVTGESIAIKVMDGVRPELVERFFREARLLSELSHPAIVRYIAHGKTPVGEPYLAMEWLKGEDLGERLRRAPLSISETLALCRRVCDGLAAAHERGVVHRDIKPSNLYLVDGSPDAVKVLDFGIARVLDTMHRATQTGNVVGTPGYMAPEQARGDHDVGAPADVFSLGCVLYECLTGKPAFAGLHFMAILAKILLEPAPRVRALRPEVSAALDDLVARMLEKEPAERPQDAIAVASELSRVESAVSGTVSVEVLKSTPASTLSRREQGLLCVLLIAGAWSRVQASAATLSSGDVDENLRLREIAARYAGNLEVLGDKTIVVVFEPRSAATDLASRAAHCALALRGLLSEVPMALATGHGLVEGRLPIGPVIDRAAELLGSRTMSIAESSPEAQAKAGRIWLDRVTAGLVDVHFEISTENMLACLVRARELRDTGRLLLGKPTPCVGRERELANLEGIFDECVSEPAARAVLITAPPGAGKSRLRSEFVRCAGTRVESARVWYGWGDSTRAGSPFGLLSQALRGALGVVDGEPLDFAQQKIQSRVGDRLPPEERRRVTEFLGELVGVRFPDDDSVQLRAARLDARIMGDQMARAWEDWLDLEAAESPVMLVLEDLHWGDLPTVKLVDAALRNLKSRPFFVLALSRPEVADIFPGLWKERSVEEINLRPLSKRACESLVFAALGDIGSDVVARIVSSAEGNAFYLEELIRAQAEGDGAEFPETVLAMVQARYGRLPPEARQLLRTASIFGQFFWGAGVQALQGASGTVNQEIITDLVDREWVRPRRTSRLAGESEYEFNHALLREAAYAALTDEDRKVGHLRAGLWLESTGERDAAALAEHFERGGDSPRASACYLRAAEQALEGDDLATVIGHAERGVACGAEGTTLGRLRLLQAEAHNWRAEFESGARCGAEAMELLDEVGNSQAGWWAWAVQHVIWAQRTLGHFARVDSLADALLERTMRKPDAQLIRALAIAATTQVLLGGVHGGQSIFTWLHEHADEVAVRDPLAAAAVKMAFATYEGYSQNYTAAARFHDAISEDLERVGHRREQFLNWLNAAANRENLGDYDRAEILGRQALEAAERLSLPTSMVSVNLGAILAKRGHLDSSEQLLQEAIGQLQAQGDWRFEAGARVSLCRVMMMRRQFSLAEEQARMAVTSLEEHSHVAREGGTGILAFARGALASALLAQHRGPEALESARQAFEIAEALGTMEDGDALVRLVYAETLDAVGDDASARQVLRAARDRLLAIAVRIDDEDLRRGFLDRVPENARTLELARLWFVD